MGHTSFDELDMLFALSREDELGTVYMDNEHSRAQIPGSNGLVTFVVCYSCCHLRHWTIADLSLSGPSSNRMSRMPWYQLSKEGEMEQSTSPGISLNSQCMKSNH